MLRVNFLNSVLFVSICANSFAIAAPVPLVSPAGEGMQTVSVGGMSSNLEGYQFPSFMTPAFAAQMYDRFLAAKANPASSSNCGIFYEFFTGVKFEGDDKPWINQSGQYSQLDSLQQSSSLSSLDSGTLAKQAGAIEHEVASKMSLNMACWAVNQWYLGLAQPRKAKVFSVIQAANYYKPEMKSLAQSVLQNDYVRKLATSFYEGAIKDSDKCDWMTTLNPAHTQSLTSTGYARVYYTSISNYYSGQSNLGCVVVTANNNGTLVSPRVQSTAVASQNPIESLADENNYFVEGSLQNIYNGQSSYDARTLAMWDAQQTAHMWANEFLENHFSRSLLQSVGVANPQLDYVAPTSGVAASRVQLNVNEQPYGLTSTGSVNMATGEVNISVAPEFYIPYMFVVGQSDWSAYASAAPQVSSGEIGSWMVQNLVPWVSGAHIQIHDEGVIMSQIPFTVSGITIGDAVERIAAALSSGLDSKNPTKLSSAVPGADRFGQFLYGFSHKSVRIASGAPYNDGYSNYAWRFHFEQSLAPLYTPQVVLENGTNGAMNTGRDGVSPPLPNANLTEFLSTMDFGSEAFVNVFMRMSEYMGQARAWKIWLRAINRMCEGRSCNHTSWNLRQFSKDLMFATTALYGAKYLPATEYSLLLHGFPTVDGQSVQTRIQALFPPAPGTTLRGNPGTYSSFAAAQPGVTFAQAESEQCNWYSDRTAIPPANGETPLYMTYQYSPFSMMGAGDRFEWRQMGSVGSGNVPNMDGALIFNAADQPLENVSVFANVSSRSDYAYYRCLTAGLVDPSTGFGLMNWDVRPAGFVVTGSTINGFAVKMTTLNENSTAISVRFDIEDPSSTAQGGPYARAYNWSFDVSSQAAPIVASGASVTKTFPKNEFISINVSRTSGGSPAGSSKVFMATNAVDTYPMAVGKDQYGNAISDSTSRSSFLFGKPAGVWGSGGVGAYSGFYQLEGGAQSFIKSNPNADGLAAPSPGGNVAGAPPQGGGFTPPGSEMTPVLGSEAPI